MLYLLVLAYFLMS